MACYVALLRAVNLAGHKMVAMADLREMLSGLGFSDPRSVLQSGNLVFQGRKRQPRDLERLIEVEAERRLALSTEFFVRSAEEWAAVLEGNPFPLQAKRDPSHLVVQFLKDAPAPASVRALQAAITGREVVRARGRELYAIYPDGTGKSRLTTGLIERKLGTRATGRNWNTVSKLAALAQA